MKAVYAALKVVMNDAPTEESMMDAPKLVKQASGAIRSAYQKVKTALGIV